MEGVAADHQGADLPHPEEEEAGAVREEAGVGGEAG